MPKGSRPTCCSSTGNPLRRIRGRRICGSTTNQHFTLKTNPLGAGDLEEFVASYKPGKRGKREESERFKKFSYDELVAREKASLYIFWLRDESLEDLDNLLDPATLAAEIVEDLEAALAEFSAIAEALGGEEAEAGGA
jgi:type I restriction enzyme M protein